MRGIFYTSIEPTGDKQFRVALDEMNHRGPDAAGRMRHGRHGLGRKRLKILDLDDRSNQPFYSRDGRYAMIFNGEIYNYRELAREFVIELYALHAPPYPLLSKRVFLAVHP